MRTAAPPPTQSLDLAFAALADATRGRIVEHLVRGPRTVSELAAPLAMSLPALSHHLRALERAGLLRSVKAGRVRTCSVEPVALGHAERWMALRRADCERRLARLDAFLSTAAPPAASAESKKGKT